MRRTDSIDVERSGEEASRRFVRVDAGEAGADAELATWLAERPEHERGMERVELAVALARRLAAEPGSVLHAEAERASRFGPRRQHFQRAFAWAGAIAALLLVAVFVLLGSRTPVAGPELLPLRAAELVAVAPPSSSVAVLPTGVVVDASTVAVLPFAASDDAVLAAELERDVVEALRTVPGLYVIADAAVSSYASTDLSPSEIGTQLGARGIVDADFDLVDARVRVTARLRDAATGATLWRTELSRPVAELQLIRYEIAENVATTMFDSSLREQAAHRVRSDAPASFSKPVLE